MKNLKGCVILQKIRLFTLSLLVLGTLSFLLNIQADPKVLSPVDFDKELAKQSEGMNSISKTAKGAHIISPFQALAADVSADEFKLFSMAKKEGLGTFSLKVNSFGKGDSNNSKALDNATITVNDRYVRVKGDNLVQEFSTSTGGIRQDFIINKRPAGDEKLLLNLDLLGATAISHKRGVKITMDGGREFIYGKLLVSDATGKQIPAQFNVTPNSISIEVDDAFSQYPIRIDPTIEDSDWAALGNGTGGEDGAAVYAIAVDTINNHIYVGGDFTIAGGLEDTFWSAARYVARWTGASWGALGLGTNGPVYALAYDSSNKNIYVGGSFTQAGGEGPNADERAKKSANHIAKWKINDGSWIGLGKIVDGTIVTDNGVDDDVLALVCNNGKVYLGGKFKDKGAYIAEYDPAGDEGNGAFAAIGSGMDGEVYALAVHVTTGAQEGLGTGKTYLYAGGAFATAGGIDNTRALALWTIPGKKAAEDASPTTAMWIALDSQISDGDDKVYALACGSNGALYIGGKFSSIGGATGKNIAKLTFDVTPNDGVWGAFTWDGLAGGRDGKVWSIAVDGANVYVGYGTQIGVYNGAWTDNLGGANIGAEVLALGVDGGNVYAGGRFNSVGAINPTSHIASYNGVAWSALGSGTNEGVRTNFSRNINAVVVDCLGSNLYVAGEFTLENSWSHISTYKSMNYIMRWSVSDSKWVPLGSGLNNSVAALTTKTFEDADEVSWTYLYAGGKFTMAGGVPANYVALWAPDFDDENKRKWFALGDGVAQEVIQEASKVPYVVATLTSDKSGNIYAGGRFTSPGKYIAKSTGGAFASMGDMEDFVFTLAYDETNSALYAGGVFASAGVNAEGVGVDNTAYIAKYDGAWKSLNAGMNSGVLALTVDSKGMLYAGGDFTTVTSIDTNGKYIAKYDPSKNEWSALGKGVNGPVFALEYDTSDVIYIGGAFTLGYNKAGAPSGTVGMSYIGQWDGDEWIPMGGDKQGVDGEVYAFGYDEGRNQLFAGGAFTIAGDVDPASHIAKCKLRFTVTFASADDSKGTVELPEDRIQNVHYGDKNKPVTAVAKAGFYFFTWTHELIYNFRCDDVSWCQYPTYDHVYEEEITSSVNITAQFGKIIYVKLDASGSGSGLSWANACTTLEAALLKAEEFDRIWVAKGTYSPGATRDSYYQMKKFVNIYGGFKGDEVVPNATLATPDPLTPILNARNMALNETILEGDIGVEWDDSDNIYNIIRGPNDDDYDPINTTLDGLTIQNGNANGAGDLQNIGGGVLIQNQHLDIKNCIFKSNKAVDGGAIYVNKCIIPNCHYDCGDPLMPVPEKIYITNTIFTENRAITGGAIRNKETPIVFTNCTFFANTATDGGALYYEGNIDNLNCTGYFYYTIFNSIFYENKATDAATEDDISLDFNASADVRYSNIKHPTEDKPYSGTGNIHSNPLFVNDEIPADPAFGPQVDLHLKSQAGYFKTSGWEPDMDTSPSIDAGINHHPSYGGGVDYYIWRDHYPEFYTLEPEPNGDRVNMGAYANTVQASKTWTGAPIVVVTAPNGGEEWSAGGTVDIKWIANPDALALGNVRIDLYKNGAWDSLIDASVDINLGIFSWGILGIQAYGTDYTIQVTSLADPFPRDTSDNDFTIYHTVELEFEAGNNGELLGGSPQDQTVDGGDPADSVTATADDDYFFINWTYSTDGKVTYSEYSTESAITPIGEADAHYLASFGTEFELTVVDGTPVGPTDIKQGFTQEIIADSAPAGEHFSTWSVDAGAVGTFKSATSETTDYTMPVGASTVKANYVANTTYTLTLNNGTSVELLPNPPGTTGSISSGATVNIVADSPPGFYFTGWSTLDGGTIGDKTAQTTTYLMPSNTATITAHYAESSAYTLTMSYSSVNPDPGPATGGKYYEQSIYTITAINPDPGNKYFQGWSSNNGGSFDDVTASPTDYTMASGDTTVTANFLLPINLDVIKGTDNTGASPYDGDAVVNITADAPDLGQSFLKWESNNGGSFADENASTTNFTMPRNNPTSDVTVTATYGDLPELTVVRGTPLTTSASPGTVVDINGSGIAYFVNWTISSGSGGFNDATNWSARTPYILGDYVSSTDNKYRFICTTAGDSDGIEPGWNHDSPVSGLTTDDDTVVWTQVDLTTTSTVENIYFVMSSEAQTIIAANYTVNPTLTVVSGSDVSGGPTHGDGDVVNIKANKAPSGQHFQGWTQTHVTSKGGGDVDGVFDDDTASTTTFTMPDNSATITASYADNYPLTITKGSGDGTYAPATEVTIIAEQPASGEYFVEWLNPDGGVFADATSASTTYTMPSNASEVTADFATQPELTVVNGTPAGPDKYSPGDEITITATIPGPNAGDDYFAGWGLAGGGVGASIAIPSASSTTYTMGDADGTITATYSAQPKLTVLNGTGTGLHDEDDDVPIAGTNPDPATYHFVNWTTTAVDTGGVAGTFDDSTSEGTTYTMPDNSATITANYALNTYTLTYVADAGGSISGINPQTVEHGSDGSEVTAIPDPGFTFNVWDDATATAARTDSDIQADATYTASFTADPAYSQVITFGSTIEIDAADIAGMDSEFRARPVVYGIYNDDVKGKIALKATTKGITKVSSTAPSDLYIAQWNRAFYLYDKKDLLNNNRANPGVSTETWLSNNPIAGEPSDMYITVKKADGSKISDRSLSKVLIAPPAIHTIEGWDGNPIDVGVHNKSVIIVKGLYFGQKAPKVALEYTNSANLIKQVRLKVQKVYEYADAKGVANKSHMDLATGDSQIHVEMPKTWWNGWGSRDRIALILTNKLGVDTIEVPTQPSGDNSNPVMTPDTITLQAGSNTFLIDVLANDKDAEADKLSITFLEDVKTSTESAKLAVSKDMVKYTVPKTLDLSDGNDFSDGFQYTANDGMGGKGTTTVSVSIKQITIDPLEKWSGVALVSVQNRSIIKITGTNFGEKKPKVTMEYTEGGVDKSKTLKVVGTPQYTDYKGKANKSYTDLDASSITYEDSQIEVELPAKLWATWASGDKFKIKITSKFDSALSANVNTTDVANVITAKDDTFNLLSGDYEKNNYYLLDVLADNGLGVDSDTNSVKVKIVIEGAPTNGKATVIAKTNKVKYIRNKTTAAAPNYDSFTYKLVDANGVESVGVTTVTLNIGLN